LIENVLEISLIRNGISDIEMLSFYKKIIEFEKIKHSDPNKKIKIIRSLKTINKLRNRLAHEYNFKIENGELAAWSKFILTELKGEKFTKFTHRTMVIHAFSTLAINIIELECT
jgi:23S rRNA maturation-related 3'-5' exoribonuclease YhaM